MKTILKTLGVAALANLSIGLATAGAAAETVLTYSTWLPPGYVLNEPVLKPWSAEVEKVTEGRVRVEWLPKAVGSAAAQFDVVHDGLADVSIILPGYTPGRFPIMEIGELPLLENDPAVLSPSFYRVYDQYLKQLKPFEGTHVLSIWASTPTHIVNDSAIITDVAQLKGMKMRAPSATAVAIMNQLGIVPIQKPVSEMYELASTGVVDGTFFPFNPILDWKVQDIFKYVTVVDGGLGQSVLALLVNERKWNAISEEDRAAIMEISGEKLSLAAGKVYAKGEETSRKALEEGGVTIKDASAELMTQIEKALEPIDQAWIKKAEEEGLANAGEVLKAFRAELDKGAGAN
ncbi:TRAP transporter substrate-binding protein [Propylenella binzhouense]|nr:TRAP transporter substrate-binding protein [Propylenella binzhouense]